ncbi:MAG: hypothetical protein WBC51_00670 [Vicinamibacterales bacterium]
MKYLLAKRAILPAFALTLVAFVALPAGSASAGRFIGTGHDSDLHCAFGDQCHFVKIATDYVRATAPDPSKPVLVLDQDDLDFPASLDNVTTMFGGSYPRTVMDPSSAEFAAAPLTTDLYSAILVASDDSCGGCDLNQGDTADSEGINARAGDIANFFNAGGGLFFNAGADHGNGEPSDGADIFYNAVPLPVGGVQVTPPFTLTAEGIALGFEDSDNAIGTNDDINCCMTHNSFSEPPPGTELKVSERDSENFPETLFAEGVIIGGAFVKPPPPPAAVAGPAAAAPVTKKATAKASIRSRAKGCTRTTASASVSGQNISQVVYSLDGKRVKKAKGNKSSVRVSAKRLKSGSHTISARITFTKATAAKAQTKRVTFVRCARQAAKPKFTG